MKSEEKKKTQGTIGRGEGTFTVHHLQPDAVPTVAGVGSSPLVPREAAAVAEPLYQPDEAAAVLIRDDPDAAPGPFVAGLPTTVPDAPAPTPSIAAPVSPYDAIPLLTAPSPPAGSPPDLHQISQLERRHLQI